MRELSSLSKLSSDAPIDTFRACIDCFRVGTVSVVVDSKLALAFGAFFICFDMARIFERLFWTVRTAPLNLDLPIPGGSALFPSETIFIILLGYQVDVRWKQRPHFPSNIKDTTHI